MIHNPIILISAPRSGSTILQRTLYLHRDLWHLPSESHAILEGPFHPRLSHYDSNRVTANQLTDEIKYRLRESFSQHAINFRVVFQDPTAMLVARTVGQRIITRIAMQIVGHLSKQRKPHDFRFIEKTPKNALRVNMLADLFPDAQFIFLTRRAPDTIASLIQGWQTVDRIGPWTRERFATYRILEGFQITDYERSWWKFALVPAWRNLEGHTLADVAAWQYYQCNYWAMVDLRKLSVQRVLHIKYEDFIGNPLMTIKQIVQWADLPSEPLIEEFASRLPHIGDKHNPAKKAKLRASAMVSEAISRLPELADLERQLNHPLR